MRDELLWLALGAALGSRKLRERLLALVPPEAFAALGSQRDLARALAQGREATAAVLARLGLAVEGNRPLAEGLIEAAGRSGRKAAQVEAGGRLERASRLLPPEEFQALVQQVLDGLRARPPP